MTDSLPDVELPGLDVIPPPKWALPGLSPAAHRPQPRREAVLQLNERLNRRPAVTVQNPTQRLLMQSDSFSEVVLVTGPAESDTPLDFLSKVRGEVQEHAVLRVYCVAVSKWPIRVHRIRRGEFLDRYVRHLRRTAARLDDCKVDVLLEILLGLFQVRCFPDAGHNFQENLFSVEGSPTSAVFTLRHRLPVRPAQRFGNRVGIRSGSTRPNRSFKRDLQECQCPRVRPHSPADPAGERRAGQAKFGGKVALAGYPPAGNEVLDHCGEVVADLGGDSVNGVVDVSRGQLIPVWKNVCWRGRWSLGREHAFHANGRRGLAASTDDFGGNR